MSPSVSSAQVHPSRQEDGVCGGARLHHGDVFGRPSDRVRRYSLQVYGRQHVRRSSSPAYTPYILTFHEFIFPLCGSDSPQGLLAGMNRFLSLLEITFRRDPNNFRPRINKLNSIKVNINLLNTLASISDIIIILLIIPMKTHIHSLMNGF